MKIVCAWRDCPQTMNFGDMPEGWRALVTLYSREPVPVIDFAETPVIRDGVLCAPSTRRRSKTS